MRGQLLPIALSVEQHETGDYFWILLEPFDTDEPRHFDSLLEAATGCPTYAEALQAGFVVLKGLSEDLDVGPRES